MEGIVAKRALKKSYYDKNRIVNNGIGQYFDGNSKTANKEKQSIFTKYKSKAIYKFWLQAITMTSILLFCMGIKYLNIEVVKEASITKKIIAEYNKTYSSSQILSKAKSILKYSYIAVKPIIPDKIEESALKLVNKVQQVFAETEETENKQNNVENKENEKEEGILIYEEDSNISKENKTTENIGVSVEDKQVVATVSSSLSSESNVASKISSDGVNFICPLKGTITSRFGAREVIFEGVDSYHTGTDIAASEGTKVVSSTDGKVTEATYNKYNGYYVEVTTGRVVTKYCHLSKISVKKGVSIKAGEKIGEVGSTGLSTGPHLHFEVVYNGTKINPELVVKL